MLRSLKNPHIGALIRAFKITTTGSAVTVDINAGDIGTSTRNSAGKSTHTLNRNAIRPGIVVASAGASIADGGYATYDTDPSSASLVVEALGASGSGDDGTVYAIALDYLNEFTDRTGSLSQQVHNTSKAPRLMGFKIAAAGTVSIGGTQASSISLASSVYTTTFKNAFGRTPIVVASPISTSQKSLMITSTSASNCVVSAFDSSEAAEDNDFYMLVLGWDATDQQWGMNRTVQVPQLLPRLEGFRVSGSGTAAIALGTTDATLVDNGTGDYTLTWTKPFAREPIVVVTGKAGRAQLKSAASTTAATIVTFGATGSAADDDFCVFVLGYDSAMEV